MIEWGGVCGHQQRRHYDHLRRDSVISNLATGHAMGADLHDQFLKSKRDQSRTCQQCRQKFATLGELKAHKAVCEKVEPLHPPQSSASPSFHNTPRATVRDPPTSPSSGSGGPGTGSRPPSSGGRHTHEANSPPSLQQHNASSLAPENPSRSQTPQITGPDGASMRISALTLDEGPTAFAARPVDLVSRIHKVDAGAPCKKRPASSEALGSRLPVSRPVNKVSNLRQEKLPSATPSDDDGSDFRRPQPTSGRLYDPKCAPSVAPQSTAPTKAGLPSAEAFSKQIAYRNALAEGQSYVPGLLQLESPLIRHVPDLKRQASANDISNDRLEIEVDKLYSSLEIVEKRCINLDQAHLTEKGRRTKPERKHWQALTALHRTLLYEHHDFLLASQHPNASSHLKSLAAQRQIPFRLWKHAIHAYLELLRQHLPESHEFMENFIYMSYQMMALLYETVPLFKDVWTECLGDLARYRMAIEHHSASILEVWTDVAKYWYSKASERQPLVGRLFHHLGILARPHLPKQLYYYCKSLCCVQPFHNARHSIQAVFDACLQPASHKPTEPIRFVDNVFVRSHKLMYEASSIEDISMSISEFTSQLHRTIPKYDPKWKEYGTFLAVANISACFSYGASDNVIKRALDYRDSPLSRPSSPKHSGDLAVASCRLLTNTLSVVIARPDDRTMLPHIHVVLVALRALSEITDTIQSVVSLLAAVPWPQLAELLNVLCRSKESVNDEGSLHQELEEGFPVVDGPDHRPLLEDYAMRGLLWCRTYFPGKWFNGKEQDELPHQEPACAERLRIRRIIWLAVRLSKRCQHLHFDHVSRQFSYQAQLSAAVATSSSES